MSQRAESDPPTIDSRAAFLAAVQWGFRCAVTQRARRIVCADGDFALWPLDEPALLQTLTDWLRTPQRKLVLLARTYDEVPRCCPRFNAWRSDWSHAIEAWIAPSELAADLPTLLVADSPVGLQLLDRVHWRGRASTDVRSVARWHQDIDAVLQRSERGFPVITLGL
jgi:hypothetical protein